MHRVAEVPLIVAGRLRGAWQHAVHTFKYRPRPQLAGMLARHLVDAISGTELPPLEALTAIPLHPARLRTRGFNQADLLAKEVAARCGIPLVEGLERTRNTPAQVGLTEALRRQNMAGAFRWASVGRPPSALGLVDDVCTTGATLEAAAAAIRLAGGDVAAFLVLASPQTLLALAVTHPDSRPFGI